MREARYGIQICGNDLKILRSMCMQVTYWTLGGMLDTLGVQDEPEKELEALYVLGVQATFQLPCNRFLLEAIQQVEEDGKDGADPIGIKLTQNWYEWIQGVTWSPRLDPTNPEMTARLKARGDDIGRYMDILARLRSIMAKATVADSDISANMPTPVGVQ